ncbi:bacteriocin immunity protein [Photobacterium halotolerans]|uniref:bacteriocin immunity protein n=1 Tax=Photobacterium halotolerans TaxID=265726 RepID=UPI0013723B3A|nr:bacteriocin immunity protein [Photobacterium halotolerans]NAX45441.1 bacteriocin immunity protein [Photobacterium halotolerans]
MMQFKESLQDYTESEFVHLLQNFIGAEENDADAIVDWLDENIQHPEDYGLVTHPTECGIDDSPEAMVAELKRWYAEQGLPCFKPE